MVVPVSLFNVAKKVVSKLGSLLYDKYQLYLSFELDLNKLQSDLTSISAVLLDAENQQHKSHSIQDWLGKLQDALHDAEDLLDDLNAEALRQKVEPEFRMVTAVRNMFFLSGMDERVKKIRDRIHEIEEQKRNLPLLQLGNGVNNVTQRHRQKEHNTRSYLRFTEVVGREEDKKAVIKLLWGSNSDEGFCVVPIVGMGGLGKTALAHLVFDDDEAKRGFDWRIWVDVSDDLNLERILQKKIIRAVNDSDHNVLDIDVLSSLQDKVNDKKCLLVLDDVWKGKQGEWLELKSMLRNGGAKGGSRILVTTRYKSTMGRIGWYNLGVLPVGDCWSLFEKWAFGEGESGKHPNLAKIGQEIMKKCGGVPLAIRSVGGLLSESREESYWQSVKNSDTWGMDMGHMLMPERGDDDILSVLKLSYDQLPSHLKECFAYCSLLPKGREFEKEDLIQLWMSQGFIHLSDRYQQLEDVGSWYFNELVSRSIFDVVRENHRTEIVKCRMHDLFHDLAKTVARPVMVNSDTTNMSESTRHVSFWDQDLREDPNSFLKLPKLRTLLLPTRLGTSPGLGSHLDVLLSGSTYLRVLDLSNSGIKNLPNSIGYMKHLRYLNLNGNSELQSLPDSICRLHSLQTLKLSGCRKISTFPRNFSYLVSLRHLVITSPYVLDKKLGSLTSLRSLTIEHCRNLVSLSEVTQHLSALRTLRIHNCGKLTSLPRSLENCTALENLEVVNCQRMRSLEVCIEGLSNFRSLTIKGLPRLVTLPVKLECYARSLQYLFITDCVSLLELPDCLEILSSLMRVYIMYCPNLHKLPSGFCHLTALQVLRIDGCPHLSTRCQRTNGEDWHLIAHVREIYVDNVKI